MWQKQRQIGLVGALVWSLVLPPGAHGQGCHGLGLTDRSESIATAEQGFSTRVEFWSKKLEENSIDDFPKRGMDRLAFFVAIDKMTGKSIFELDAIFSENAHRTPQLVQQRRRILSIMSKRLVSNPKFEFQKNAPYIRLRGTLKRKHLGQIAVALSEVNMQMNVEGYVSRFYRKFAGAILPEFVNLMTSREMSFGNHLVNMRESAISRRIKRELGRKKFIEACEELGLITTSRMNQVAADFVFKNQKLIATAHQSAWALLSYKFLGVPSRVQTSFSESMRIAEKDYQYAQNHGVKKTVERLMKRSGKNMVGPFVDLAVRDANRIIGYFIFGIFLKFIYENSSWGLLLLDMPTEEEINEILQNEKIDDLRIEGYESSMADIEMLYGELSQSAKAAFETAKIGLETNSAEEVFDSMRKSLHPNEHELMLKHLEEYRFWIYDVPEDILRGKLLSSP